MFRVKVEKTLSVVGWLQADHPTSSSPLQIYHFAGIHVVAKLNLIFFDTLSTLLRESGCEDKDRENYQP